MEERALQDQLTMTFAAKYEFPLYLEQSQWFWVLVYKALLYTDFSIPLKCRIINKLVYCCSIVSQAYSSFVLVSLYHNNIYMQYLLYSNIAFIELSLFLRYIVFKWIKNGWCNLFLSTFPGISTCLCDCTLWLLWELRRDYFPLGSRQLQKLRRLSNVKDAFSLLCSHHFYIIYVLLGLLSSKAGWSTLKKTPPAL